MNNPKKELEKSSKIIEEKNVNEFLNSIQDKTGCVNGLDSNIIYNLLEKCREDYKNEVKETEKKLKKVDNEAKLNYEDLIKITKELRRRLTKGII